MPPSSRQLQLMGTTISLTIYHTNPEPILDQAVQLLHQYNKRFSANDKASELMAINLRAGHSPVPVSSDLYDLIAIGLKHSLAKPSQLNIAIGPLVKAWRIGFADAKVPTQKTIEQAIALSDPLGVELSSDTNSVYLKQPGMAIDLGAIAKGYIADQIVAYLKQQAVPAGLINLGGNVLTFGPAYHNPDHFWRVGIQDPHQQRGKHLAVLAVRDQSVVTSGIYERKLTHQGQTYHHIFDPETGFPIDSDLSSLTIISKRSVDAEIWTSRLFGYPPSTILAQAEQEELGCLMVSKDNRLLSNSKAQGMIYPTFP